MSIQDSAIKVPLDAKAHSIARQFAALHETPQKGKRVYLNTLAVYAVQSYLAWFDIPSDLERSDCWNPDHQILSEVADLVLPDIGKLECRPVLPTDTLIPLPPDALNDRLGYVAVQFSDVLDAVSLLGFVPAADDLSEHVSLEALQPLETLINYVMLDQSVSTQPDMPNALNQGEAP